MLCPSRNKEEIISRHDTLTFFLQPQLTELTISLQKEIQRIADLSLVSKRLVALRGTASDWIRLMHSIAAILECGRLLEMMVKYTDCSKYCVVCLFCYLSIESQSLNYSNLQSHFFEAIPFTLSHCSYNRHLIISRVWRERML